MDDPALLGASLYLVNLGGTWIYDDAWVARDDPRLHDVHRWGEFLTKPYIMDAVDELWRPLPSLTYAVQFRIHPQSAWPFHGVNLLLHSAVSAMVARLGFRISASRAVAMAAGMLFAAHPIHVEAVSGIVGRAEELCAVGVLGALLLSIGGAMTVRRAWGITGCFLLAAFSKEQGLLVPLMLLTWFVLGRRWGFRTLPDAAGALASRWLTVMLTASLATYISYRNYIAPWYWEKGFLDPTVNPLVRSVGIHRWLIPVSILGRYASLLAIPWRLAPDYGMTIFTSRQRWDDPYLYVGAVSILAWGALALRAFRRRDLTTALCLACLAITYFLAGNFVMIGTIFGERLMYLPSVFLCIAVASVMGRVRKRVRLIALSIVMAFFCARTESYAWQWNDTLRFYRHSHQAQPRSAMIALLLGDELRQRGDAVGAEAAFAEGRQTSPDAWRLWDASARLAIDRGDWDLAMGFARRSFHLRPSLNGAELIDEISNRTRRPRQGA